MVDQGDIAEAITDFPAEAAEALEALQPGAAAPKTMASLAVNADSLGVDLPAFAANFIVQKGWTEEFVLAMKARGVPLDTALADGLAGRFDAVKLSGFLPRAEAFRCRVIAGEGAAQQVGSGCLIGPSLVLTAWHVVAAGSPEMNLPPKAPIKVRLSDGQERKVLSTAPYLSACTALEFASKFPKVDADFVGHNDVAVLQLESADGARLGFAELPTGSAEMGSEKDILVADFPEGRAVGWTPGRARRIPNLTARMRHDARVAAGSSGGACFNYQCELVGIHQGRWDPAKRLVPLARFLADIRDAVANDVAPPSVWSLDGTPTGGLVIGRDLFFQGVAEASRRGSRARGLRVRRRDVQRDGTAGLSFTYQLLRRVLELRPGAHRLLRIGFDMGLRDLLSALRSAAAAEGFQLPFEPPALGVRQGDTTPEAAVNDQAKALARQLNDAAGSQLLWIFFENPVSGLNEAERLALEAFVAAAVTQPALRVVLAGFETLTTPGEEFTTAGQAREANASGLIVESIGWFLTSDVEAVIRDAARSFGTELAVAVIQSEAQKAVLGLQTFNGLLGYYSQDDLRRVSERLQPILQQLKAAAGGET